MYIYISEKYSLIHRGHARVNVSTVDVTIPHKIKLYNYKNSKKVEHQWWACNSIHDG